MRPKEEVDSDITFTQEFLATTLEPMKQIGRYQIVEIPTTAQSNAIAVKLDTTTGHTWVLTKAVDNGELLHIWKPLNERSNNAATENGAG